MTPISSPDHFAGQLEEKLGKVLRPEKVGDQRSRKTSMASPRLIWDETMNDTEKLMNRILSFARYLSWADLLNTLFKEEMSIEPLPTESSEIRKHEWRWFGLMCYWYASLYVVIEAWDEMKLNDPVIDRLLAHPKDLRSLLRRYRNGVFHFQSSLLDPKIIDLLRTGTTHAYWVHALHNELVRFFAEHLARLMVTDEQCVELRAGIESVVNWYPCPEPPAIGSLAETLSVSRYILARHQDDGSEHRKELEQALATAETILQEGRKNWAVLRKKILREVGIE